MHRFNLFEKLRFNTLGGTPPLLHVALESALEAKSFGGVKEDQPVEELPQIRWMED
jgi:hypothetical protein